MAFGVEIYSSSGQLVLSMSNRVSRFAQNGVFTIPANSNTTVTVSGMENNDSWFVFITGNTQVTYTLNTGFFRANNATTTAGSMNYWVVRS